MEREAPNRDLTDLERRVANVVRFGVVSAADYGAARVRVTAGQITTGWLPVMTSRAHEDVTWWMPEVGEQVVVVAPTGDLAQGVVLGAVYQARYPAPADRPTVHRQVYADGTIQEYDREAHHWLLDMRANDGTMEILTGTTQILIMPGNVYIRADRIDLNDDR